MTIPRPISRSMISTAGWGIPVTDEVNALRTAVDANTAAIAAMQARKIVVAFAQITSTVIFGAATNITGLVVTFTSVAGHRYRTSIYCTRISNDATANKAAVVLLYEGSTALVTAQVQEGPITAQGGGSFVNLIYSSIPTVGAHTYQVVAQRDSGTESHNWFAASTQPSYIMVEDVT